MLQCHLTNVPAMQVKSPGYQTHTKRFHQWHIMMMSTLKQKKIARLLLHQTQSQFPMTGFSVSKKQMSYLLLEYYLELVQSQTTQHKQPCILHVTGSFKLNYNIDFFKPTAWNQDYSTSLRDWAPLLLQYGWRATFYKGVIFEVHTEALQKTLLFRDVMLCQWVQCAFMVRVKHSKNCGLLGSEDEGTEILWNVSTHILSADMA
jgi:hypothetical protein